MQPTAAEPLMMMMMMRRRRNMLLFSFFAPHSPMPAPRCPAPALPSRPTPLPLQYHVIPAGAVLSSQLKDNQTFATALSDVAPLRVRVKAKNGKTYVKFVGATNWAKVVTPDVRAGNSVVHIVKDVLLPAGVGIAGDAEGWKGN
jgi:hypothetical protein